MMTDDYKNSDNFQGTEGYKIFSPHHSHPTNGVRPLDSNEMRCEACGKEVFDNGEERFACPYCGAEIVAVEESTEERIRRLERELTRQKLNSQIEELSAADHFWTRGNLFSMLDRQSARADLERGDFDGARRHLAKAEKWFNIGCFVQMAVVVAIVLFLIFGKY